MQMIFLAFDYGEKRIGAAVGDALTGTAQCLPTINGTDWAAIQKVIADWRPAALVVGLPLHESGAEQPITAAVRRFAQQLRERSRLSVHICDERYSSRAADDELRGARASGRMTRRVRKGDRDGQAARVILEQWLMEQKNKTIRAQDESQPPT